MRRVGHFEKVSFEQFRNDWYEAFGKDDFGKELEKGINVVENNIRDCYENIKLPKRSTSGSAGYDFYLPFPITLVIGKSVVIPTGVCCAVDEGWMLQLYPRSGHGFKYGVHLANTVGIIDSDYYFADNEGHIHVKLSNDTSLAKEIRFEADDKFCQGIFTPYGITIDDDAEGVRTGGFGSTGK